MRGISANIYNRCFWTFSGTGVTANSLHPGAVGTNIWEALNARPWPKFLIEFTKSVIKYVHIIEKISAELSH